MAEPRYWVYENGLISKAIIHVSYCHHCNDGHGVKDDKLRGENKWHGPYNNLQQACQVAQNTGRRDIRRCRAQGSKGCAAHWASIGECTGDM